MERIDYLLERYGLSEDLILNMQTDDIQRLVLYHGEYQLDILFRKKLAVLKGRWSNRLVEEKPLFEVPKTVEAREVKAKDDIANQLLNDGIQPDWLYSLIRTNLNEARIETEKNDYVFYILKDKNGNIEVEANAIYYPIYNRCISRHCLVLKDDTVMSHKKNEEGWC